MKIKMGAWVVNLIEIARLISICWNFLMPKAVGSSDPLSREQEGKKEEGSRDFLA